MWELKWQSAHASREEAQSPDQDKSASSSLPKPQEIYRHSKPFILFLFDASFSYNYLLVNNGFL